MLIPDLYVFILKFHSNLAYKKDKNMKKKSPPKNLLSLFYATFQFGRYSGPQKLLIIGPTLFFHSPAQTTAHSPEWIFHIMKSRDQTSVLLSVEYP
jgi:hypothetical protein